MADTTGTGNNDPPDGATGVPLLAAQGGADRVLADRVLASDGDDTDPGRAGDDADSPDPTDLAARRYSIAHDPADRESGTITFFKPDGVTRAGTMSFSDIEKIIACFTPGTLIATRSGEVAVEHLRPGDLVLTRDQGYLPLAWVGQRTLSGAEMAANPEFLPVRISRGALGQGAPDRDIVVSPQHRMLMTGPRAQLFFAENEVLVPAGHMVNWPGVTRVTDAGPVSYLHVMFDDHQIICAQGAWTESFQLGLASLCGLDGPQRAELLHLFPDLADGPVYACGRLSLQAHEARLLMPG